MKEDFSEEYITYRIKNAKETLDSAKILITHSKWNSAINRLYYSCFYIVSDLLFKQGITAKTHQGLRNQFNKHFILTGIFPKEFGELYSTLLDWRYQGDYGDLFDFSEDQVLPMLSFTEGFLLQAESYLFMDKIAP